jgi:hypothetical protein
MPRVRDLLRVRSQKGCLKAAERDAHCLATKPVKLFDVIQAQAINLAQMFLDPLLHAFLPASGQNPNVLNEPHVESPGATGKHLCRTKKEATRNDVFAFQLKLHDALLSMARLLRVT